LDKLTILAGFFYTFAIAIPCFAAVVPKIKDFYKGDQDINYIGINSGLAAPAYLPREKPGFCHESLRGKTQPVTSTGFC
jgi:hypothetical protein